MTEKRDSWFFLSTHGMVLLAVLREPDLRIRDIAAAVGVTERTAQQIVGDLVEAGYMELERVGRRNHYRVIERKPMRHALTRDHAVGELFQVVAPSTSSARSSAS